MTDPVTPTRPSDPAVNEARRNTVELAKNAIRALPPMHVIDTDYVPQAKRRPDAVIDRAAALLAIEHILDEIAS